MALYRGNLTYAQGTLSTSVEIIIGAYVVKPWDTQEVLIMYSQMVDSSIGLHGAAVSLRTEFVI